MLGTALRALKITWQIITNKAVIWCFRLQMKPSCWESLGVTEGEDLFFRLTCSNRNPEKSLMATQDYASWLWGSFLDLFCPKYLWMTAVCSAMTKKLPWQEVAPFWELSGLYRVLEWGGTVGKYNWGATTDWNLQDMMWGSERLRFLLSQWNRRTSGWRKSNLVPGHSKLGFLTNWYSFGPRFLQFNRANLY